MGRRRTGVGRTLMRQIASKKLRVEMLLGFWIDKRLWRERKGKNTLTLRTPSLISYAHP